VAKALPVYAVNVQGTLAENAPLILHIRLEEVYQFAPYIEDVNRVAELHNMRIAAKRLRYTMEIFSGCFPEKEFEPLYEVVTSIQEQIGQIHDCDVRQPLAEAFLESLGSRRPEVRVGLQKLIDHERANRDAIYTAFIAYWVKLQSKGFKRKLLQLLASAGPLERGKSVENRVDNP
jgi:CHAD domain-containing protein